MFNSINGTVQSIFDGIREARKDNYDRRFNDLNKTWNCWIGEASTPLLEVAELNDLLDHAKTKEHYDAILDHLYRHDATRVKPYKKIENKIIDQFWED
jgi:hypothetical protein